MGKLLKITTPQITSAGTNEIVQVDLPARCKIHNIMTSGPTNHDITIYSRAFTWTTPVNVTRIDNDGNNKCQITTDDVLPLAVGDAITVAATGVGGYNTTHRVTAIVAANRIVTNIAYSSTVLTGTLTLAIPAGEQMLYTVVPAGILVTTNGIAELFIASGSSTYQFVNDDPLPFGKNVKRSTPAYLNLNTVGTYRFSFIIEREDIS